MLFEYLPEIPPPPQEYLYKSLDEIRLNASELSYFPGVYGSFLVRNKMAIEDALRPYFSFDVTNRFGYQYIGENMVVHKDIGRVETYNFILDTGGDDVTTVIYDEDKTTILHEEVIRPNVWHRLRVDKYHNVLNITRPRFMMMVFEEAK